MTIITACCDEASRRVTDCVAVRSLAAICALVASSRPTPDATSVARSTCSVELSATSPPSSHSHVRPLRHHQEIKWRVVKKWKMGVFCKQWTFPRRVHYAQYQYFLFYILLILGGGAYAPNAPPAYGPGLVQLCACCDFRRQGCRRRCTPSGRRIRGASASPTVSSRPSSPR